MVDCLVADLLVFWIAGLLECWIAGLLHCWIAGLPGFLMHGVLDSSIA